MPDNTILNTVRGLNKWAIMYKTRIEIDLEPCYHEDAPRIRWGLDGLLTDTVLAVPTTLTIDQPLSAGSHRLDIEFYNKTTQDTLMPVDKAVRIANIRVEGLSTVKLSQGTYWPEFPEPWATEQQAQGIDLFETYRTSTYLGWNGRWVFEFSCPIYQWIHRTENLGLYYS